MKRGGGNCTNWELGTGNELPRAGALLQALRGSTSRSCSTRLKILLKSVGETSSVEKGSFSRGRVRRQRRRQKDMDVSRWSRQTRNWSMR